MFQVFVYGFSKYDAEFGLTFYEFIMICLNIDIIKKILKF